MCRLFRNLPSDRTGGKVRETQTSISVLDQLNKGDRFASNIASEGYVVALPSSFHEFEGPEAIPYDTEGTNRGNKYKVCERSVREIG